jgi:dihydrofolate reductase
MIISLIVAISKNYCIGKNNQLLWHLPKDLKFFKQHTTGKPIIMGRKTYDSIGKPLPNRRNIVISRNKDLKIEGAEVVISLQEAIALCKGEEEVCIIGGGKIYNEAVGIVNKMYITMVDTDIEGDTYFPKINLSKWYEVFSEKQFKDEKHIFDYTFKIYIKE